jgi:hypothetical protein
VPSLHEVPRVQDTAPSSCEARPIKNQHASRKMPVGVENGTGWGCGLAGAIWLQPAGESVRPALRCDGHLHHVLLGQRRQALQRPLAGPLVGIPVLPGQQMRASRLNNSRVVLVSARGMWPTICAGDPGEGGGWQ